MQRFIRSNFPRVIENYDHYTGNKKSSPANDSKRTNESWEQLHDDLYGCYIRNKDGV